MSSPEQRENGETHKSEESKETEVEAVPAEKSVEGEVTPKHSDNDETAEDAACNPELLDNKEFEGELERMRGDAIGNTLYSERFVLKILLKLTKVDEDLSKNKEFEKELCNLWDMTLDKDVVSFLVQHQSIEIFAHVIEITDDKRLTEIMVGIVGNMCVQELACEQLTNCKNAMQTMLQLVSCCDTPTLVQLMRLYTVVFSHSATNGKLWLEAISELPTFVTDLSGLLHNSANKILVESALTGLNAMLANFTLLEHVSERKEINFANIFVNETLVESTLVAFEFLLTDQQAPTTQNAELESEGEWINRYRKAVQVFLNIHCILLQYNLYSCDAYSDFMPRIVKIMAQLLQPYCLPHVLLPLTTHAQDIIVNVSDILLLNSSFGYVFDAECFDRLLTIWHLVQLDAEERASHSVATNDFQDDEEPDPEVNQDDLCLTMIDFITRSVHEASLKQLHDMLAKKDSSVVAKLCAEFDTSEELVIQQYSDKIRRALAMNINLTTNGHSPENHSTV